MRPTPLLFLTALFAICLSAFGSNNKPEDPFLTLEVPSPPQPQDTIPLQDRYGDFLSNPNYNPFDLNDPDIIEKSVEYDPSTGQYIITERIGDDYFRPPTYMTFEEYLEYRAQQQEREYFRRLSGLGGENRSGSGRPDPMGQVDVQNSLVDRLFGGTDVDIRPRGNIDLTFGVDFSNTQNPGFTQRQQRQGGFDFDMAIQMNVEGSIGKKLRLSTNYNTQATFDFDNTMKLDYSTDAFSEDDIIKKIEAGNVSLPLRGSLITGSQSLFGVKTELQFGRLRLTAVASQQKSEREEITLQGGSQIQRFEVRADQYDENRHFFLTHYNRDNFEDALSTLPEIKTLFKIARIQVWVTDTRNATENIRDIVAIADLGEPRRFTNPNLTPLPNPPFRDINGQALPDNFANPLYAEIISDPRTKFVDRAVNALKGPPFNLQQGRDFEKVSARLLSPTEFTYHEKLGIISLNVNIQPDQVVGVAFEYFYGDSTYQVGQLAEDISVATDSVNQNVLFVKMLKSTTQRVDLPTWDLMMKNVYSIGAFQVAREDFKLDIFYEDPGEGKKRFLPESNLAGIPLIRVFNLDNVNTQLDPQPDGVFDFIEGLTINSRNGRIMFPVLEPFGSSLARQFDNPADSAKFVYKELYTATLTTAREFPEKNRFTIEGTYKSSISNEISLGAFNIPQGSVTVTAGGQILQPGRDYEIDYNLGRVRILNDAILNSGVPIRVSFEDNTLFGFQTKTMLGLRADYELNKHLTLGGTFLQLFERPYTNKVNIGDDPINNKIYGLDINYSNEAPWLTRLVDKIPLIDTKAPSNITFSAEAAALRPGHSKAINEEIDGQKTESGVVYLDDFEGSVSSIDLRTPFIGTNGWVLASVPRNDARNNNPMFPEAEIVDTTLSGVNRAKINWFRIDPSIRDESNNPYSLVIPQEEVFRNFTPTTQLNSFIPILDIRYDPTERGPYNFDLPEGTPFSAGLDSRGKLRDPGSRWAGIMRSLTTNDFEAANIEFIEFWLMSPYLNEDGSGDGNPAAFDGSMDGYMFIELGNISEDILLDSRKFFENGLPGPNNTGRRTTETGWGRVPLTQQITTAFDIDPENRRAQDVGLDGMPDSLERQKFNWYLNRLQGNIAPDVLDSILQDPSNDNFRHFRDYPDGTPVEQRYSRFYGTEGNSPPQEGSSFVVSSTTLPDGEDLDRDRTLNETESYFQYRIPIRFDGSRGIDVDSNPFITESIESEDGRRIWYRFRVPLNLLDGNPNFRRVGGIQDFRSIRFIRMYFKEFERKMNFRFARLELVRNQWRRYRQALGDRCASLGVEEDSGTEFDVDAVNIEENSTRAPFGYTLPPGITRERALGVNLNALQNEQALTLSVCNLEDGDARGIYKIVDLDMRVFKKLRMFVHAEEKTDCDAGGTQLDDGDLTVFIRLGSDFQKNYYEYELPLAISRDFTVPYTDPAYQRVVWRAENDFDVDLQKFVELKLLRNKSGAPVSKLFALPPDDPTVERGTFKIIGNPSLGLVKSVMIGIRNPSARAECNGAPNDDGLAHSVEVWVNELRVSGLDERGGVAATARADFQLADFGSLSFSGRVSSIGWGGLDQQLDQRAKEEIIQYDVASNVELGKFFPENSGLRIPFFFQFSQDIRNPQFDPYDLDVELKEKLNETPDPHARDSIREQAQTVTTIKSLNFTNVRKERTRQDKKPMPWDVANFSLTYAYDQTESRDPIIEQDVLTRHRAALDYQYQRKVKYIEPLKNAIEKDKYLKFITGMNFNPLPNSFGFSTELDRRFNETKYRFAGTNPLFNTYFNKQFLWNRSYDLQWDLTRNLKLQFFADNQSIIDEPDESKLLERELNGEISDRASVRRDSIWENIKNFGRTKAYNHSLNINYTVPTKDFPFLDWINARATYQASYSWNAASQSPFAQSLGNVIQNSQNRQANLDLDFTKIYGYSKYLKAIDSRSGGARRGSTRGRGAIRGNQPDPKQDDQKGADDQKGKKDKKKKKDGPGKLEKALIRPLLFVRKARVTYQENFSTIVPGYMPGSEILGMDNFGSPGWDFILGLQPNMEQEDYFTKNDWLYNNRNWISSSPLLNSAVSQNYRQTLDGRLTLEPIRDFKVDIEVKRELSDNHLEEFRFDSVGVMDYTHQNPRDFGSYTITFAALKTLFNDDIAGLFDQFEANRLIVASRLTTAPLGSHQNPEDAELLFPDGFGRTSRAVLVPAFLAAYTGQDANTIDVDRDYVSNVLLKILPKPNWRLTYNGLSKIPLFKEIFQSVSITHGYRSTLTVNRFETKNQFDFDNPDKRDPINFNFYSRFEVPDIVIQEQFSPLIGIDMRLQNDMSFRFEIGKSRNLNMSFGIDEALNETRSDDVTLGFGYRLQDVNIGFLTGKRSNRGRQDRPQRPGGRGQGQSGDLNINFDFSLSDDITIRHLLDQDLQEPTRGTKTLSILPAAEYQVNRQLSLRFFFDYRRTVPKTSQGFPRTDVSSGITVRFSLN